MQRSLPGRKGPVQGHPGRRISMGKGMQAGSREGNSGFINNKNLSVFGTLWVVADVRF